MRTVVVTNNYPSLSRPYRGVFVRNFARALARAGVRCSVINPVSVFHRQYGKLDPVISHDSFIPENPIEIRQPRYVSASNKNLWAFNTEHVTQYFYDKAVARALKGQDQHPDVFYGHFVYPSGAVVARLGAKLNVPSIMAMGEDLLTDFVKRDKMFREKWDIRLISGVIAVSSANKRRCVEELSVPEDKIMVLPNGVDLSLFFPRDRTKMRKKYGLPINKTIAAFTGYFEDRKGPNRIMEAIKGLDEVGIVLIGAGSMPLTGDNILFKGALEHEKVPEMLCAADMFVLPTLSEGSCNAILEAMACGLPIVTSNCHFNDEIVDHDIAIRINPHSISEIREAIRALSNDFNLCRRLSVKALAKAKNYDINLRTRRMLEWIKIIKEKKNENLPSLQRTSAG